MFHFDIESLIQNGGILLVAAIVFAESGLLIGFFLPGDTLLLSAGILAAQGKMPLGLLIFAVVIAGILGDNVGYSIGHKMGRRLFRKKDSLLFHQDNLVKAENFYENHGGKTMLFARFIPIVRTFAPMVAGIGRMPRKRFVLYDTLGVMLWGVSVTLIGYFVGSRIPDVDKYILPTILAVMLLTFGPTLYHLLSNKENRKLIIQKFKPGRRDPALDKKTGK